MNISYLKGKADYYEVYAVKQKTISAEITKNETDFAVDGEGEAIAITVIKNKKIGFAFTSDIKKFKETADKALDIARANSLDKDFRGLVKPQKIRRINNYDRKLDSYSLEDFSQFKKEFLQGLKAVDKKILLSSAYYSKAVETINVMNSEGVDLEETSALNSFAYDLILKRDTEIIAASGVKGDIKPLNPEFSGEEAQRVRSLINRKQVNTMNCEAAFHPEALAALLAKSFIPGINAESKQRGKTILADKLNKKIMSDKITIIDDATTKGLVATSSFDCEGTPSQRNTIVKDGVLKAFLYNNRAARKENKRSTGNAIRTAATLPTVGANNVIIQPGKEKDAISRIKKGVYIRELLGVHTMNTLTGDFSLGLLEGHYVENGRIKHPIKNAMIAGNLYDLLGKVVSIGDKAKHAFVAHGAFYLPEIRFEKIKLVGKD